MEQMSSAMKLLVEWGKLITSTTHKVETNKLDYIGIMEYPRTTNLALLYNVLDEEHIQHKNTIGYKTH